MSGFEARIRARRFGLYRRVREVTGRSLVPYAKPRLRFTCPDCGETVINRPVTGMDVVAAERAAAMWDTPIMDAHRVGCSAGGAVVEMDGPLLFVRRPYGGVS